MNTKSYIGTFCIAGFLSFLISAFMIMMKVTGTANYSWLVIMSPLLFILAFEFLICTIAVCVFVIRSIIIKRKNRYISYEIYNKIEGE